MELALKNQLPDFNNPAIAARAWADEFEKRELAEKKVKELAPKAEVYDAAMNASNNLDFGQAAKAIGIGRNKLIGRLRDEGILMKTNIPYQSYLDRGYFYVSIHPVNMGEKVKNITQTFVAPKGIDYLARWINNKKSLIGNVM